MKARRAARLLASTSQDQRKKALSSIAGAIHDNARPIQDANEQDIYQAIKNQTSPAFLDRLKLDSGRLISVIEELQAVNELPDPIGEVFERKTLPNGLAVEKVRVPLGVLGVVYESRPNVTVDISGLALKSGNAVILRGGHESIHTNLALVQAIRQGLAASGLAEDCVQFIDDPDRALVLELLKLDQFINMIIPRGGAALHEFCRANSRIPVITGGIGICHLFVDESADLARAIDVIRNAKIQRPTVCNALDTVLVHQSVAAKFLPALIDDLAQYEVEFRLDKSALTYFGKMPLKSKPAGPADFDTEWLSLVLGLKVVSDLNEAIEHIAEHSTAHSDGILTGDVKNANEFINRVDSAAVYVNASTRFTDGGQLGLGAEVAISTQRLHARGPMGLNELTTYKWVIQGDYHTRP